MEGKDESDILSSINKRGNSEAMFDPKSFISILYFTAQSLTIFSMVATGFFWKRVREKERKDFDFKLFRTSRVAIFRIMRFNSTQGFSNHPDGFVEILAGLGCFWRASDCILLLVQLGLLNYQACKGIRDFTSSLFPASLRTRYDIGVTNEPERLRVDMKFQRVPSVQNVVGAGTVDRRSERDCIFRVFWSHDSIHNGCWKIKQQATKSGGHRIAIKQFEKSRFFFFFCFFISTQPVNYHLIPLALTGLQMGFDDVIRRNWAFFLKFLKPTKYYFAKLSWLLFLYNGPDGLELLFLFFDFFLFRSKFLQALRKKDGSNLFCSFRVELWKKKMHDDFHRLLVRSFEHVFVKWDLKFFLGSLGWEA